MERVPFPRLPLCELKRDLHFVTAEIFKEKIRLVRQNLLRALSSLLPTSYSTTPATRLTNHDPSLLATNFSSFTTSAANLRIPSAVFSVAIASSFSRYLNFFSSSSNRSIWADFAISGLSFLSTGCVDSDNSCISSGLVVSRSDPASSIIWLGFRKLAAITSVGYRNFL